MTLTALVGSYYLNKENAANLLLIPMPVLTSFGDELLLSFSPKTNRGARQPTGDEGVYLLNGKLLCLQNYKTKETVHQRQ